MGDLVKLIKKCVKKGPLTITAIAAKLSVSTEEISEIIKKKPKKFHLDGETVCASASLEVTPPPSPAAAFVCCGVHDLHTSLHETN